MICTDPFVAYLKSYGYNVVRLPKADIQPLQVLSRQGRSLGRLGDLADIMVSGEAIALPEVRQNVPAANISGQKTSNMNIGIGLNILGTIIGAIGGTNLGLDLAYKGGRTVQFEFQDVYEDSIKVTQLDKFLADADIDPYSRHVARLLESDELYVINSSIKSTKFTVEAYKKDGAALELKLPVIQEIVGGEVKVSGEAETTSRVTYESPVSLVFGFQAVQLYYDQGIYTAYKPLTSGIGLRALENLEDDGTQRMVEEGVFVQLADW
jgi:hypothetical protein